jgi:hypothetical protein
LPTKRLFIFEKSWFKFFLKLLATILASIKKIEQGDIFYFDFQAIE